MVFTGDEKENNFLNYANNSRKESKANKSETAEKKRQCWKKMLMAIGDV